MKQIELDKRNASFWNEICGSNLAKEMNISEISAENLELFDREYFKFYPYLLKNLCNHNLKEKKVLEIGLGYGSVGQFIASRGSDYYGIDIAYEPVNLMRYRLSVNVLGNIQNIQQGSVLNLPFENQFFDCVYSIGCLHHTGNLVLAISEIQRVLKPGGYAYIMVYNRHSFRQLVYIPFVRFMKSLRGHEFSCKNYTDSLYDINSTGINAPHIEYVSLKDVYNLFQSFSNLKIQIFNFDNYSLLNGRINISRKIFLNNVGRVLGLDLYILAQN